MNLVLFSLCLLGCNLGMKDNSNIEITNIEFKSLLKEFQDVHSKMGSNKNKIISVSVWVNESDTTVGLYADKKLKAEYYIGYLKTETNEIYFYSNHKGAINGLYNVISAPKIKVDSIWDYKETYTMFYNYKNGTFVLQSPPVSPGM